MKRVNFNDVVFDQPVTIIATVCNTYADVTTEEFYATSGIDIECITGFGFNTGLGAGYESRAVEEAYVKYISLRAETAKIEQSIGKFDKKIILIDYTGDVLDELNRQKIPYYRPAIEDDPDYMDEDWQFETRIEAYDYTRPYLHKLILIGLQNAGITKFKSTDNEICKLFRQVEKEFNRQDEMDLVYFIDSYGHLVSRTIDHISTSKIFKCFHKANIGMHVANTMACVHSPYMSDNDVVVFNRKDAEDIVKAIDEYLVKNNMTDIDLFGNAGISYERLYDVVNGLIYPLVAKDVPTCYWSYKDLPSYYRDNLDGNHND